MRAPQHDLEQNGRPERRRGQRGGRAVEPEAATELRQARPEEQEQGDVAGRVEDEVEPVRHGRVRRSAAVGEVEEQLRNRPRADADRQRHPRAALDADPHGSQHARGQAEQDEGVVQVPVEEVLEAEPAPEDGVGDEDRQPGDGEQLPCDGKPAHA